MQGIPITATHSRVDQQHKMHPGHQPLSIKLPRDGLLKNEIWNNEIHITGNIRLEKDVTLTIEPGTTVYIAANSNDQQSGWSADDEYTRKYNDPVRLES
jgi:hypothetical protein